MGELKSHFSAITNLGKFLAQSYHGEDGRISHSLTKACAYCSETFYYDKSKPDMKMDVSENSKYSKVLLSIHTILLIGW